MLVAGGVPDGDGAVVQGPVRTNRAHASRMTQASSFSSFGSSPARRIRQPSANSWEPYCFHHPRAGRPRSLASRSRARVSTP